MLRSIVSRFVGRNTTSCRMAPEVNHTLERLREINRRLDFSQHSRKRPADPTVVDLLTTHGEALCFWLYDSPGTSVARVSFDDGAYFPDHTHEQFECWVVYEGYLEVTVVEARIDRPGRIVYYVYPGSRHSVKAIGKTEVIVIAIPRSDSFPRGPDRADG